MELLLLSLGLAALEAGISALASAGKPVPPDYLKLRKEARKALVELAGEEATTPEQLEPDPTPDPEPTGEPEPEATPEPESDPGDPSDDESPADDDEDTSMTDNIVQ